jgi:hypothetical protein
LLARELERLIVSSLGVGAIAVLVSQVGRVNVPSLLVISRIEPSWSA